MESDLEARGWCDLARASCGKVLATCPDRFARVAKTHNERDYKVAAPSPLPVPRWLCCVADNIADERLGVMRNQKHSYTELDELCVPLPFDWEDAFEDFARCSLKRRSDN